LYKWIFKSVWIYSVNFFGIIYFLIYFLGRKVKTNSVIGDIVLVFSPSFQSFYRGKIINIVDNTDFHVLYIDFGNPEVVKFSNIFELPDNLKNKVLKLYWIISNFCYYSKFHFINISAWSSN